MDVPACAGGRALQAVAHMAGALEAGVQAVAAREVGVGQRGVGAQGALGSAQLATRLCGVQAAA